MIFSTLILVVACAICGLLWHQSEGQTRMIAGVAALAFGVFAALNGLQILVSLGRRLVTLLAFLVVGWAIFTIVTKR